MKEIRIGENSNLDHTDSEVFSEIRYSGHKQELKSIEKIEIADQPVFIIDKSTKEGKLIYELVSKLKNNEKVAFSTSL